jgi:hypothetical protein
VIPPGNRNHEIIPTTGKHGGYQVTKGFSFSDMAAQVNDVHNKESQSVFREYASTRWLQTFGTLQKAIQSGAGTGGI